MQTFATCLVSGLASSGPRHLRKCLHHHRSIDWFRCFRTLAAGSMPIDTLRPAQTSAASQHLAPCRHLRLSSQAEGDRLDQTTFAYVCTGALEAHPCRGKRYVGRASRDIRCESPQSPLSSTAIDRCHSALCRYSALWRGRGVIAPDSAGPYFLRASAAPASKHAATAYPCGSSAAVPRLS